MMGATCDAQIASQAARVATTQLIKVASLLRMVDPNAAGMMTLSRSSPVITAAMCLHPYSRSVCVLAVWARLDGHDSDEALRMHR